MRGPLVALLLVTLALSGCLRSGGGIFDDPRPVDPYDYLTDQDYTRWVIEVDAVTGWEPRSSALSLLRERMGELAVKQSIAVDVDGALPSRERWTTQDLLDLQRDHQDRSTGGDAVVTWVAYVDGAYFDPDAEEDRLTLGLAIGHDLVVIFKEAVESTCDPTAIRNPETIDDPQDVLPCLDGEERIEQAVLVHEFGHVVGLVDRGIPMVTARKDSENGAHSNNPESVMYWAIESAGTLGEFNSQIPLEFDADDKADVCAAGGRC